MMKKLFFITLLISFSFSQTPELSQGFGFAAGMQSGIGFSYRHIGEKHGLQLTIGAIGTNYNEESYLLEEQTINYNNGWTPTVDETYIEYIYDEGYFWGNVGLLYIKPLHRVEKSMFYGFIGLSTQYNVESYYERPYQYFQESATEYTYKAVGPKEKVSDSELRIFGGVGLGLSYNLTKNITLSFELPLTISDDWDIWMIVPQGAIHYYYK